MAARMDLRQLRYFIALAEHRSFVRAAEAIGISQPAFSRAIQGLENELGCQLVDRGSRDLRPTPQGQLLLQHALNLVRGADNLSRDIQRMGKLDAGEVQIGVGPLLAARLLPAALRGFLQRYPRIHVRVQTGNGPALGRSLLRDEIELILADDVRQFEADPAFAVRLLAPRPALFFCRPGHPLLAKESLSTNDLFAYPLLGTQVPAVVRKALANLSGRDDFRLQLACEELTLLRQMVLGSDALGVASHEALQAALERGEFHALQPRNLPAVLEGFSFRAGLVSRAGVRLSPAALAMQDILLGLDTPSA